MSDRTFNLNVLNVADKDALQGLINGDKNGLFQVIDDLNPATGGPVDENVGALVPKGNPNANPNPDPNPDPDPDPDPNPDPDQVRTARCRR